MATAIPQNRARFTPAEIAAATGGRLMRDGPASEGICTDSRAVSAGSAFVALAGERFDGHSFLAQAAAAGAATFVVSDPARAPSTGALIVVADTRRALGDLARAHRDRSAARIIAVTGSAGKTTTRRAIAALLERIAPGKVHAPPGNLNNDIGVPMTLLGLEPRHAFAVVELGTNHPGEIARLAEITRPDVGVVTLVAAAHTEGLGDLDGVAKEKGALFAALSEQDIAIGNADDARVKGELARSRARARLGYGFAPDAAYRIIHRAPVGFSAADLVIERPNAPPLHLRTPLLGEAGALATCAAVAAVESIASCSLESSETTEGLAPLGEIADGRLSPRVLEDGTVVIDDSYNANAASMAASVAAAAELAASERRPLVLVLGAMRELGALSAREHERIAEQVAASPARVVVAVGADAAPIAERARAKGKIAALATDAAQAIPIVLGHVRPRDVILVKGSRGIGTERIVEAVAGRAEPSGRGAGTAGRPGEGAP